MSICSIILSNQRRKKKNKTFYNDQKSNYIILLQCTVKYPNREDIMTICTLLKNNNNEIANENEFMQIYISYKLSATLC